ncbi:hypothetical protein [Helicobacter winghamensis]|uniref:Lipoprotein n=1 Tax=Helicobacter winghamensis TaxID=157268 RepID=A0A2N3PKD1_9HELI|nr:hypothetical protein [Helicobacter winghamensis]EEO25899.1 hypothetical protein HWAG_00691 [Helicobacter winghamensis ATCC BAA-430]PKT77618.1 hypothetical protein BCM32_05345 [Helicobacter winghamensis]PKT81856.1 hypothetical protein BCM31_01340 [Helicobacter winghamensis]PKT82035.1 hypothetical protein BCM33_00605 [Helicobacter winghamensis]QOQ98569.1 hypothetical protein A0Z60_03075 [Helicobacter winghamensis]
MNTKVFKIGLIAMCAVGFFAGCGEKDELAYLNEREFTKEEFQNKEFLDKVSTHCSFADQNGYALKEVARKNCSNAFYYLVK